MREKTLYLPKAENDLVFAFVGNGWLLLAGVVLLAGVGWMVWRILRK